MSGRETKRKRMKQRKSADSIAVEAGKTLFMPTIAQPNSRHKSELSDLR